MYETAGDLSSLRDVEKVLRAIVRRARQLLRTDAAYLTPSDEERDDRLPERRRQLLRRHGPACGCHGEWDVIVVGAHFAAALVARDLGDTGPDPDRRFDFAATHDRALVIEAAATLLARISPLS